MANINLKFEDKVVFNYDFEDKEKYEDYKKREDIPLYNFLRELHDLPGGKEVFVKNGAWIDVS